MPKSIPSPPFGCWFAPNDLQPRSQSDKRNSHQLAAVNYLYPLPRRGRGLGRRPMVKYSRSGGWDAQLVEEIEIRAYRAGLVAGAVVLVAALRAGEELSGMFEPRGRGALH